ncbi:hypothetical protein [Blastomonas sp.]|uniref:hypothetical protein n=1 Tax=Blastomonas sp. TaxID=1909299 RepID=UPI002601F5CE|nr:hypothetical protein [Blastomonas sp.]MDM7956143.1 hypothetical protein [Blastomonas sp.]
MQTQETPPEAIPAGFLVFGPADYASLVALLGRALIVSLRSENAENEQGDDQQSGDAQQPQNDAFSHEDSFFEMRRRPAGAKASLARTRLSLSRQGQRVCLRLRCCGALDHFTFAAGIGSLMMAQSRLRRPAQNGLSV